MTGFIELTANTFTLVGKKGDNITIQKREAGDVYITQADTQPPADFNKGACMLLQHSAWESLNILTQDTWAWAPSNTTLTYQKD